MQVPDEVSDERSELPASMLLMWCGDDDGRVLLHMLWDALFSLNALHTLHALHALLNALNALHALQALQASCICVHARARVAVGDAEDVQPSPRVLTLS